MRSLSHSAGCESLMEAKEQLLAGDTVDTELSFPFHYRLSFLLAQE